MTNFHIKITSDTICPWCYFGYRRLQKGIVLFQKVFPGAKNDTFTIHWAPFYLNPDPPANPITIEDRLADRVGIDQVQKIKNVLTRAGAGDGVMFKFGGKIGNTRDSHRLLAMAEKNGLDVQSRVAEQLFKGLFEEEQDITSHDFLIQAARASGLEEGVVRGGLASDECGETVDNEVLAARQDNIKAVPHFSVNQQHEMSGAQDPSEWMEIFTAIKQSEDREGP